MPTTTGTNSEMDLVPDGSGPVQTVLLEEKLDLPAAGGLAKTLLELRGVDLVVDASGVRQMGAQIAQVLASAASTWSTDRASFRIVKASPEFCEASQWLGLSAVFETEVQVDE